MSTSHEFQTRASTPRMQGLMQLVATAASGRDYVLIIGEPGTGREAIAREIHGRSSTAAAAGFVKITSTAPAETLERELFGFQLSRTGGEERRNLERIARGGQLHDALGGTLFLEHLTEIPARIQARLARLFRDREAMIVQDRNAVGFDVRAIAAADATYDQAVEEGRIRNDLHRVISTIRIDVPPLRERREDIPGLAGHFLAAIGRRSGAPPKTLSEPALQLLTALPWPGNVRELERLLHGLAQRVRVDVIRLEDILSSVQLDGRSVPSAGGGTLREARARFEREYIAAALDQHSGRIPDAARMLGIQRTNLYRKLKRLKIPIDKRRPITQ
jgi:two-component system, NtrC family, nitrogen regulation response regulator GlnG